jgi:hypothetical protein
MAEGRLAKKRLAQKRSAEMQKATLNCGGFAFLVFPLEAVLFPVYRVGWDELAGFCGWWCFGSRFGKTRLMFRFTFRMMSFVA